MPITSDLIQAKQTLSSRLLAAGFRGDVVFRGRTLAVAAAVASAGRNVHAVGVGSKVVEGKLTSQQCLRVYVIQKLALSLLPPRDRLPDNVDGIPTDIIEAPPAFASARLIRKNKVARRLATGQRATIVLAAGAAEPASCTTQRQAQQRPVLAGISVAHHDVTAGTLSYFCRSTRHGDDPNQVCVLSNNHIFANLNRAQVGDVLYQPGPADGGVAGDHFADFLRCVPLQLDGASPNRIDGAVGNLLPGLKASFEICSIGKITGTTRATESMAIRKHGRTTGYTEGIVTDELIDALVGMDPGNPNALGLFQNQFRVVPSPGFPAIGKGGDSGALVVRQDAAEAVGLYFANPSTGEYGYANHIADVLHDLEIELL